MCGDARWEGRNEKKKKKEGERNRLKIKEERKGYNEQIHEREETKKEEGRNVRVNGCMFHVKNKIKEGVVVI